MSDMNRTIRRFGLLLAPLLLAACTSQTVKKVNAVQLQRAQAEIGTEALLDVGIAVFDPGVTEGDTADVGDGLYPQVRKAEARYVPYTLRRVLEQTNQWGAVRVLPEPDPAAELLITGEILESDGTVLAVRVRAVDALGREWLDKGYEDTATQFAYRDDIDYDGDPFQNLYHQIANDLLAARAKLNRDELVRIRTVASLKYAAELSPAAFGDHLSTGRDGQVAVNRLPAPNDPMLARVNRIREAEYLFVDTVDQQYAVFYHQMDPSYDQWRRYSYEETLALADVKRSARTRLLAGALAAVGGAAISSKAGNSAGRLVGNAAVLGGLTLMKQGYDTSKQSKIHQEALKELATSFDAEVAPVVMEVEGEVVKLNGSLEAQYQEWRRLLREIYAAETGFPVPDDSRRPADGG